MSNRKTIGSIVSAMQRLTVVLDRFAVPFAFREFNAQWYLLLGKWPSVQDL